MKRLLAGLFCCLLLFCGAGALTGCNAQQAQTISLLLSAEPATLDPQIAHGSDAATLISALYEGLCRLDENGDAQPGVAESWEANSTNTQFTFHLREDAVWNGNVAALTGDSDDTAPTPVTASDFIYAWQRALDPATGSTSCAPLLCIENAPAIHAGTMDKSALGVEAPDDHTLVVHLSRSCPDFPEQTAATVCMPCSADFFASTAGKYGLERVSILGNGPFEIRRYGWEHGVSLSMAASDTYRGEAEAVPGALQVTFGAVTVDASDSEAAPPAGTDSASSAAAREVDTLTALSNGQIDAAAIPASRAEEAEAAGLTVQTSTDTTWGLCFHASGKFSSAALRQAFLQALDREALESLLPAGSIPAEDPLPPDTRFAGASYRDAAGGSFYMRESDGAAALYQSQNLGEFSVTLLCTEENKELASQMLANWNETFETYFSLEAVDEETLRARVEAGSFDVALYPLSAETADAGTALSHFLSGQNTNPTGISDPQFDSLLSGASTPAELAQAEKRLCDAAVFYPVYYVRHAFAAAPGISGVWMHGFCGGMDFLHAQKDGG